MYLLANLDETVIKSGKNGFSNIKSVVLKVNLEFNSTLSESTLYKYATLPFLSITFSYDNPI